MRGGTAKVNKNTFCFLSAINKFNSNFLTFQRIKRKFWLHA